MFFFFSSRRRHTRFKCDWSSDVCSSDLAAMYAYSGILSALLQRARTGRGLRVEVSMLEALAEWMSYPLNFAHYGGTAPARSGLTHPSIAPYGQYTADRKSTRLNSSHT